MFSPYSMGLILFQPNLTNVMAANTLAPDITKSSATMALTVEYEDHDDVIKWKHFPRYWSFVPGIHRSLVNSLHKGQWRRALMVFFDLRLNKWLSKQSWGSDLRCYRAHYDVTILCSWLLGVWLSITCDITVLKNGTKSSTTLCFLTKIQHIRCCYFVMLILYLLMVWDHQVSEWVIKFNSLFWTMDIRVHVVHTSHEIITYTLESLSSLT